MQKPAAPVPLLIVVSAAALFMEMLDANIILTALPVMAADFGVSPVAMSIGMTTYALALAAMLPLSGWLADRYGTRHVFMIAVTVFGLASVACGLSKSLTLFALARVVQGFAAALMSPVARIAQLKLLDRRTLARAMNIGIMAGLLGPAIGPPLGGFVATYWSWHWIFYVNVPIAVLGLLVVRGRYPDLTAEDVRPFDWQGAVLNALSMVGLIYGLQMIADNVQHWERGLVLTMTGALVGWFAWRHAGNHAQPLVSLSALKTPSFRVSALGGLVARAAIYAPMFVMPLLLQLGLGMSALAAGMYLLTAAAADVLCKLIIIDVLRRYGHRRVLIVSALLCALTPLGLLLLSRSTPAALIFLLMIYAGIVRSFHMTSLNTLSFADIPQEESSNAAPLMAVLQQIALALGVAISALAINIAVSFSPASTADLERGDFRFVLLLTTAASLYTLRWFLPLPADAGARASGYEVRAG